MSAAISANHWDTARRAFIEAGGHTTQSFGLGRIIGQVYALLYLSPLPLCLDNVTEELGVSKASVSTTIRQLESWSAVKRVWVKGDRKDYYEAETDFSTLLRAGVLDTVRKKLDTAGTHIHDVEHTLRQALSEVDGDERKRFEMVMARVERAKRFHRKVGSLLNNPLVERLM